MWPTRPLQYDDDASIGLIAFAAAALIAFGIVLSGLSTGLERSIHDTRDQLRIAPASGDIVILEIDGRSLQALDEWPWPRSHYATAIAELDRMGAEQIAFDVEFSARSQPEEDATLAEALAQLSEPAILPTFRQESTAGARKEITEALPIPEFRDHAFLASVNVSPAANGRIVEYPHGVRTAGVPRPSLPNMLAKTGGEVGNTFRIDQAIDIETIPRLSFIDVIEDKVAREQVEGRRVVIGATAIELFDRYPTALFGVQPGVVIQVQAAETLMQGRDRTHLQQMPGLVAALLLLGGFLLMQAFRRGGPGHSNLAAVAIAGVLAVVALVLDQLAAPYVALTAPLAFLATFAIVRSVLNATANLRSARLSDTLSGLPNRAAMTIAQRQMQGEAIAVARIDDIAEVVTMLGDTKLGEIDQAIARRLTLLVDVEKVYRLDSGVFGWFVPSEYRDDLDHAFAAAAALFNAPFEIAGERLKLSAHFGCGTGSIGEAEDASELARKRGLAWSASGEALVEASQYRQRLLGELDDALRDGAISVVFQPKLRLSDNVIASAECLVRWKSHSLGEVSPSDFIPVLEEKSRIDDLTLFVLRTAIEHRDKARSLGHRVNLAVNVSAQLLSDKAFNDQACAQLKTAMARKLGGITLEITESAPMSDGNSAREALDALANAGARISIDDYGTGQASLNYLQDFPAQEVKLDQSFVRNLLEDRKDRIMVQSTVDLAHALGFDIVAEGIEDAETLSVLAELGCDYGQGWAIGRPMGWGELVRMLGAKGGARVAA